MGPRPKDIVRATAVTARPWIRYGAAKSLADLRDTRSAIILSLPASNFKSLKLVAKHWRDTIAGSNRIKLHRVLRVLRDRYNTTTPQYQPKVAIRPHPRLSATGLEEICCSPSPHRRIMVTLSGCEDAESLQDFLDEWMFLLAVSRVRMFLGRPLREEVVSRGHGIRIRDSVDTAMKLRGNPEVDDDGRVEGFIINCLLYM